MERVNELKVEYDYLKFDEVQYEKLANLEAKIKDKKRSNFLFNNIDSIILDSKNEFHNYMIEYLDIDVKKTSLNIIDNFINNKLNVSNNLNYCIKQLSLLE